MTVIFTVLIRAGGRAFVSCSGTFACSMPLTVALKWDLDPSPLKLQGDPSPPLSNWLKWEWLIWQCNEQLPLQMLDFQLINCGCDARYAEWHLEHISAASPVRHYIEI